MLNCFYLIPLFNAVVGWLSVAILIKVIFAFMLPHRQKEIKARILQVLEKELEGAQSVMVEKINKINLEQELGPVLDKKLDCIIKNLQTQIPMGDFLLGGALGDKLRQRIKKEIVEALPEVKEAFAKKAHTEFDLKALVSEKVQALDLSQLEQTIHQNVKPDLMKAKELGALVGAGIGLIEILFMLWLC